MSNRNGLIIAFCIGFTLAILFGSSQINFNNIRFGKSNFHMPLVKTSLPNLNFGEPIAKRDESLKFYLQCSVRIRNLDARVSGSGTICYYDQATNEAYIISCGHLFKGDKSPESKQATKNIEIDVFYKNDNKLSTPQVYQAEVICYDNKEDISILKFTPDWTPQHYFNIGPTNYDILLGEIYESCGCDHGSEAASYTVEIIDGIYDGQDLISKNNSPRPGRSGGGLLSPDGYYIGIVWGTSALDGSGYGFYVPLRRIHDYLDNSKKTLWLLSVSNQGGIYNSIPIFKKDGKSKTMPRGYIPSP